MYQVVWNLDSATRTVLCNAGSTERFSEGVIATNENCELLPLD